MKVLALYEIHGNVDALEAVLGDPRAADPDGGPHPPAGRPRRRRRSLRRRRQRRTAYDAARAGARILAAGWPDERCVRAALVEPVEPIVVTRIFEALAAG